MLYTYFFFLLYTYFMDTFVSLNNATSEGPGEVLNLQEPHSNFTFQTSCATTDTSSTARVYLEFSIDGVSWERDVYINGTETNVGGSNLGYSVTSYMYTVTGVPVNYVRANCTYLYGTMQVSASILAS